ncbi:putative membrane protein [Aciduliprofundum sp. MAR08-339]|uniref:EamA family transporter n=1 Tax=Aciduliprofundum sp. (strain MAR08-339) TaxID=673860 RepID=UPI0002A4CDC1|nr:putative membrane protein [Aciduliprofundum sp. MAR08-339]
MQWWVYALITMLMFGLTNFLVKMAGYYNMDSIFTSVILWLAVGLMGLAFLGYFWYQGTFQSNLRATPPLYLLLPIFAGFALAIGMYSIKIALSKGPAGPTVAISASNAFIVALFAYFLIGEKLSTTKILGMLLIFAGIAVMTLL